jgi:hypothetical protein
MSIEQYIESTKYLQWEDGMYVMLDDLECDYELALVEDSLRRSVYFIKAFYFDLLPYKMCLGINRNSAGAWVGMNSISSTTKLTRAQALYIATGDVNI